MKFALINPTWNFEGAFSSAAASRTARSVRYAKALLERSGPRGDDHRRPIRKPFRSSTSRRSCWTPSRIILCDAAPNYLFWRCALPSCASPGVARGLVRCARAREWPSARMLRSRRGRPSTSLGVDLVIMGEFEEVLAHPARRPAGGLERRRGGGLSDRRPVDPARGAVACQRHGEPAGACTGRRSSSAVTSINPAPRQRFPSIRAPRWKSRAGCAHHCSFCAKDCFRGALIAGRPLAVVLEELDTGGRPGRRLCLLH